MVAEITVILKDEEKTLRTKHLIYDSFSVDISDPVINDCIQKTINEFTGKPDSIKLKINLEIQ